MNKILIIEGDINNAINGFRKELVATLSLKFEVIVIGSITQEKFDLPNNTINIKYYNLGNLSANPIFFSIYLFKIFKIYFLEKPIICLSFNLRPNIANGIMNKIFSLRSIATITGTSTFLTTSNFLKNKLLNFLFSDLDLIVFQNLSDKELFENRNIKNKKYLIIPGSGIDTSFFSAERTYKKHLETTFILISRIIKEKGILEYIKAAQIVKNSGLKAKFYLLGPFYISGKIKDRIDVNIINSAVYNNFIEYLGESNNVIPFIINSDCVVLPSYREGMSNLLLEAASLCTPIITSNVPGCMEIVEDNFNGYLCNSMDSIDLADKIIRFIHLPEKEREIMGKNGREKVVKEFEKSIVVNKYLNIVDSLINKHF